MVLQIKFQKTQRTVTFVGITAFADDPDMSDDVTYSLSNDAGGLFAIDSSSGVVTVASQLDYETAQSHPDWGYRWIQWRYVIYSGYTIDILDFNEFAITQVTDSDAGTNEVSEAALAGTIVGLTAFAEDLDLSHSVTYAITNDPSGAFAIDEG